MHYVISVNAGLSRESCNVVNIGGGENWRKSELQLRAALNSIWTVVSFADIGSVAGSSPAAGHTAEVIQRSSL